MKLMLELNAKVKFIEECENHKFRTTAIRRIQVSEALKIKVAIEMLCFM
jgi:hypothetical protein